MVAPLAGAWIEIAEEPEWSVCPEVAPLAGAWIEIANPEKTNEGQCTLT